MDRTPTPDEAGAALQEMSERRGQVAAAGPRWVLIAVCALFALLGVLLDVLPAYQRFSTWLFVALMIGLTFAARHRRLGSLLGFQVAPRGWSGTAGPRWRAQAALAGILIVVMVGLGLLRNADVPWGNTIGYTVAAILIAVLLPWAHRSTAPAAARERHAG